MTVADQFIDISIHAPARGATLVNRYRAKGRVISIHAPARGATPEYTRPCGSCGDFNPRTRKGCDHCTCCTILIKHLFQSTHPQGVRRQDPLFGHHSGKFQSTHPQGVRQH